MKLGSTMRHVSGKNWKGFQGQRSKVKVVETPFNGEHCEFDISLVTRRILMKLAANIWHGNGKN